MADRSLYWGKGIKKLVDEAERIGYRFEVQGGTLNMIFEGKCPPYMKSIRPIFHAIGNNKDSIIEYLHFQENVKKGGESHEVENL